jgi:hypothetical protein
MTQQEKRSQYIEKLVQSAKENERKQYDLKEKDGPREDEASKFYTEEEKVHWLQDQFQLKKSPFLQNPSDLKEATDVLLEFWDLFSRDGSFGLTHLIEHEIITDNVAPIKSKYRPINPALEPDLRKQLDNWITQGVVEESVKRTFPVSTIRINVVTLPLQQESVSPWSSNLVAARKKNGGIRWCVGRLRGN